MIFNILQYCKHFSQRCDTLNSCFKMRMSAHENDYIYTCIKRYISYIKQLIWIKL